MAKNRNYLIGFLVAVLALIVPTLALAAEPRPVKDGITISPFLQRITIQPNDAEKTFAIKFTNNTSSLQELRLKAQDFGTLNETGGVLLEGNSGYTKKYGLTSWLRLGSDTVVLRPKESREIQVTIQNRTSLQPGGHYAAVVASVKALDGVSGNQVAINQQLMSLILVNKTGGEHYALKLVDIDQNGNVLKLPSSIKLRFQNPGNVHVVPRGTVLLKSPSGRVLAKGLINSESAFVLPETFREIYVPLTKVSNDFPFPGLYQVEVDYRYDGVEQTVRKTAPVKFINIKLWIGLLVCVVIIWRLYVWRKTTAKRANN